MRLHHTIGKWPHLARHLREGTLCAPLGSENIAHIGGFYLILASGAAHLKCVSDFVDWLRAQVQRNEARAPAFLRPARRAAVPVRG